MDMYRLLNMDTWNRKEHFRFFSGFDFPYFDVCCNIDCTPAYRYAKQEGLGFFRLYLYYSLRAANETEPFTYRIHNGEVRVYNQVNASPTIQRADGSFGFAYIDFQESRELFFEAAGREIERVQNSSGLVPAVSGENVIHYSALPWVRFTSITHARHTAFKDSIPKISFGKITEENGKWLLPLSVSVHHALMDGFHVGQYIERFTNLLHSLPC